MINNIIKIIKKIIVSGLLLYGYDSINIFNFGIIPINFFTLLIVSVFGFPGLFFLVLFSFII